MIKRYYSPATSIVPIGGVVPSLVLDGNWCPDLEHLLVLGLLSQVKIVELPLQGPCPLPVLLCDGPVLDRLILVGDIGKEVTHLPAKNHMGRGPPVVLYWSNPELHHGSHQHIIVQAAIRAHIVTQQILPCLYC